MMATNRPISRQRAEFSVARLARQYRSVITASVEGLALLLRLPVTFHVILTVATDLAISALTGRRVSRRL